MKKLIRSTVVVILVLTLSLGILGTQTAHAVNSADVPVSDGWLPFAGSLYDPQTNSHISLNGWVHIVTRVTPLSSSQWHVDLYANLPAAGLFATRDTGIPYLASGAGQSSGVFSLTGPYRLVLSSFLTVPLVPPNPILPPNPIQPVRFGLQFNLVFSATGVLNFFNASTVQVADLVVIGPG